MPCLKILTNVQRSKIPVDFVEKIIPVLSRCVGKPEEKFLCVVSADCQFCFGGDSTRPGAAATLESIGHITPERNKIVAKEISEFVTKEIGIDSSRFFITFYDVANWNVGLHGTTIDTLEK